MVSEMPLGEVLAHAERCRTEGRLMEAEAVCHRALEAQPNLLEAMRRRCVMQLCAQVRGVQ
jgi:hypothetical protein